MCLNIQADVCTSFASQEQQALVKTDPKLCCSARACTNVVAQKCEQQSQRRQVRTSSCLLQLERQLCPA